MIAGRFGENRELLFEVELMASNNERFSVEVLLDTDSKSYCYLFC